MFPNKLKISTDYATLKNDSKGTILSVNVTAGTVVSPGLSQSIVGTDTVTVGTLNAPLRARANTTKFSGWFVCTEFLSNVQYKLIGVGDPNTYTSTLYSELVRINSGQIRLYVAMEAVSGGPDRQIQDNQTITFVVSTFLSPFDN